MPQRRGGGRDAARLQRREQRRKVALQALEAPDKVERAGVADEGALRAKWSGASSHDGSAARRRSIASGSVRGELGGGERVVRRDRAAGLGAAAPLQVGKRREIPLERIAHEGEADGRRVGVGAEEARELRRAQVLREEREAEDGGLDRRAAHRGDVDEARARAERRRPRGGALAVGAARDPPPSAASGPGEGTARSRRQRSARASRRCRCHSITAWLTALVRHTSCGVRSRRRGEHSAGAAAA